MNSVKRIQLDMPEKAVLRLQILKEKTEAVSYAEVVKNALRLYEAVIEERERGGVFQIRDTAGVVKEYVIF